MSRIKVPRASLAVTMLDDPDYIELCQDAEGRECYALFCAMLTAAKVQDNGGRFKCSETVLAMMVRWPVGSLNLPLCGLEKTGWLIKLEPEGYAIKGFAKWNSGWGGSRKGAGRKPAGNQEDSSGVTPASVTVTKDKQPTTSREASLRVDQKFAIFLLPMVEKPSKWTEGDLCRLYNTLKKEWPIALIQTAGLKAKGQVFRDYQHVHGWFRATLQNLTKNEKQTDRMFESREEQGDKFAGIEG